VAKVLSFIPVNEYILVRRDETKETTVNGIVRPDSAVSALPKATVMAVGDKVPRYDGVPFIVPGDEIILTQYGGEDVLFGQQKITIVRWDEVKLICKVIDVPDEVAAANGISQTNFVQ
jgi:co-chaperonin GroES (HSP10)